MSGRAQYSPSSDRALYSSATGRALYEPTQVDLSSGSLFANFQRYDVTTGSTGVRSDIYPSVLENLVWTWSSTNKWARIEWGSFGTFARLEYRIVAMRFDTSAYSGRDLLAVRKYTYNHSENWRQQSGGGAPMWAIRASADSAPTDTMAWVEGSSNIAVPDPSTTQYCMMRPSVILDDYLWCITYIADLQPPTTSGQECWLYSGSYTIWV